MKAAILAAGLLLGASAQAQVSTGGRNAFSQCTSYVQSYELNFDAYLDNQGTVHMWAPKRLVYAFNKCMNAMGYPIGSVERE